MLERSETLYTVLRFTGPEKRREMEILYLVLLGSLLLPCRLYVPEAPGALEGHPHPSCHPARALLCSLQGSSQQQWQR